MRVTGAVLACALVAATAGACGHGLFGAPGGNEELRRASKALADMDDPSVDFTDRAEAAWQSPFHPANRQCGRLFDLAEGKAGDLASATHEATSFRGGRLGESTGVVLAAYAPSGAREALRSVAGLMRDCAVASVRTAGGGDRLVGSELPVGAIGDGVEARRFRGRVGGYPYEMHLVVVRSGDMLISLVHTGLARLDPERTAKLAAVVAARVGRAAE
ncbi:hypothetical protein [Sphaerisporangium corydalis]|uniref:Sensor domain-containing protein n=1 Tax=Sphaerisporangium corydalis TaxID=1441875 RepID=A0ABV9E5E8_9ACTN|nr:hypothetical protein [Sphaerisporangium corydalis]